MINSKHSFHSHGRNREMFISSGSDVHNLKRGILPVAVLIVIFIVQSPCIVFSRENSVSVYNEGIALAQKGDIDAAIPFFEKAVKLSPNYALAHYALGRAYLYKESKMKDAVRELSYSVRCDRRLAKGYFYLGMAYLFSGKYDRAIHSFNDAYSADRALYPALYNIGSVYDKIGQTQKARQYFTKYFEEMHRGEEDF